ncbi:MAG TPA: peptidylprolyl isomerase [Candidatus Paceibacterota bacterium]
MDKFAVWAVVLAVAVFGGAWYFLSGAPAPAATDAYSLTKTQEQTQQTQQPQTVQSTESSPAITNQANIMQATLRTTKGDIVIEFSGATPNTVANFTKLAGAGFYNGTKFHRVIPGFMIQGGDPLSKDDSLQARWGTGGPGYQFADEIAADNRNTVGTIAMANSGPNTNGSQFFINVADNSFLDTKHTVFGKVIAGLDVVKAIEATPTAAGDRPIEPMVITSVDLK